MDRGQTFFFQWMEPRYFFHTWSRPEYFFLPKPEPEYFFLKKPRPPPGNLMVAPLYPNTIRLQFIFVFCFCVCTCTYSMMYIFNDVHVRTMQYYVQYITYILWIRNMYVKVHLGRVNFSIYIYDNPRPRINKLTIHSTYMH